MIIRQLGSEIFEVKSESDEGKSYIVNLKERSCTCPSYKYKGFCKHIAAVDEFVIENSASQKFK